MDQEIYPEITTPPFQKPLLFVRYQDTNPESESPGYEDLTLKVFTKSHMCSEKETILFYRSYPTSTNKKKEVQTIRGYFGVDHSETNVSKRIPI